MHKNIDEPKLLLIKHFEVIFLRLLGLLLFAFAQND